MLPQRVSVWKTYLGVVVLNQQSCGWSWSCSRWWCNGCKMPAFGILLHPDAARTHTHAFNTRSWHTRTCICGHMSPPLLSSFVLFHHNHNSTWLRPQEQTELGSEETKAAAAANATFWAKTLLSVWFCIVVVFSLRRIMSLDSGMHGRYFGSGSVGDSIVSQSNWRPSTSNDDMFKYSLSEHLFSQIYHR